MKPIAHIYTDFPTKFGLPRQSGLVEELRGRVVFEPEFSRAEAFRGLEEFSHVWILWEFNCPEKENWSATVRPPRLGGNTRLGVFATRSPFRPNRIGLSCVKLEKVVTEGSCELIVAGIDMMSGTAVLDVKPYIPFTDCRPEATGGFTAQTFDHSLEVVFPPELLARVPEEKREALSALLGQDPRPGYNDDPERVFGVEFAGMDVRFTVDGEKLTVTEIV